MKLILLLKDVTVKTLNGHTGPLNLTHDNQDLFWYDRDTDTNEKIDEVQVEIQSADPDLQIDTDGTAAGKDWHIVASTSSFDKGTAPTPPAPRSGVKWTPTGSRTMTIDTVSPTGVNQSSTWILEGPGIPGIKLRIQVTRKS